MDPSDVNRDSYLFGSIQHEPKASLLAASKGGTSTNKRVAAQSEQVKKRSPVAADN